MHDVGVPLDDHQLGDAHSAGLADATEIVAAEVHQHDVLGALLLVGQQVTLVLVVLFLRLAARLGPGYGAGGNYAVVNADELLRRGPDDVKVVELEVVHVWRGVNCPQRPVDLQRVRRRGAGKPSVRGRSE